METRLFLRYCCKCDSTCEKGDATKVGGNEHGVKGKCAENEVKRLQVGSARWTLMPLEVSRRFMARY